MDKNLSVSLSRNTLPGMRTTGATTHSICARLRAIRTARGLSLLDVEIQSKREIRAVVLGSYERGDRSLSIKKAIALANFYAIPLTYLLEEPRPTGGSNPAPIIDLRRVRSLLSSDLSAVSESFSLRTITTFISGVVQLRNDYNGEVLSMRQSDLTSLALTIGRETHDIVKILSDQKLLIHAK